MFGNHVKNRGFGLMRLPFAIPPMTGLSTLIKPTGSSTVFWKRDLFILIPPGIIAISWVRKSWGNVLREDIPAVLFCLRPSCIRILLRRQKTGMRCSQNSSVRRGQDILTIISCTGCSYCTPGCPMRIPIPKVFSLYNEDQRESPTKGWSATALIYRESDLLRVFVFSPSLIHKNTFSQKIFILF